jgi:hypothetical protein
MTGLVFASRTENPLHPRYLVLLGELVERLNAGPGVRNCSWKGTIRTYERLLRRLG